MEGSARISLEKNEYVAEKNSMIIINSNELHSGYVEKTPYLCKVISLNPQNFLTETSLQNALFQPFITGDPQIGTFIDSIFQEYEGQELAYKDSCRALITQFLVYLNRNYTPDMLTDKISEKRKRNLERLNQVLSYIEEHSAEHVSNSDLAEMMHLSEDRFGHLFRKNIGMAPQQYINEVRLQKAKELIQSSDHTITEISRIVGFQDYNHFGRKFLKRYGCTPKEAQKQNLFIKSPKPS